MHYRFYTILILFIISSCSSYENRFDDIDFIAYSWRIHNKGKEWKFYCTTYGHIDDKNHCDLMIERFYPKSEINYYRFDIKKEIIDSIIQISQNILNELDLRPRFCMYDGPSLKIKINKNNDSKVIHYYDIDSDTARVFIRLYEFISLSIDTSFLVTKIDTSYLEHKRKEFIIFSMRSDSILHPPPPPPSEIKARPIVN